MKFFPSLFFWVCTCSFFFAQDLPNTVIAEQGDGIFSLLRKQGLDPVKHYEEFIKLNEEKIKDGSFLQVGVAYQIPKTTDSFKKTGVQILGENGTEEPIFDKELAKMSLKSEKLKDAVYYLIVENDAHQDNGFVKETTQNLASELMVHGAQVYILGNESPEILEETEAETDYTQKMDAYIDAINKRYLQNSGKYQRVLVIRDNAVTGRGNMNVAVYHYNKSEEGQRLAENIQNVFKKNSVSRSPENSNMIFEDSNSLYLAKNTLPAVSLLTLDNDSPKSVEEKISVRPNKKLLANLLTNGIMNDFADLEIEE
ncbi:N-acetylmuramoyl-L-alanine amidase [Muricauda sp. CAU 1633]|uniref:N-acetylmuramoyl-L-alanine amidase n=1 Tax=Allomuricauda sp. CAU 1633 TaxID=2816036 RepID=UPI001A904B35|nr:N-acetylmuramoyl-L-alanine amidase [Muricauda sp. CAU 1633]MBO0321411.1 N-acetylmuramoyl-L-alanine amidase [Muricauda sp. CAU 1633]